jgi:hypothetical protein
MSAPLTPLQEWLVSLRIVLEDAREELDVDAWRAFVWIAADEIGFEAARLVVAEAVDATASREAA